MILRNPVMQASRKSPVHRSFGMLIMLLLSQLALPACSAQTVPGVKWYAGLKLGDFQASSVAAWRDALSQPWRLGNEPVSFSVSNSSNHAVVDRCDKLFPAVADGMRASGPDQAIFEGWTIKCEAVRILVDGAVPQKNFVDDFSLNETGIRALPIGMAFVVSPDDERKSASIQSKGGTLGGFLGDVKLEALGKPDNRRTVVRDDSGASQLLSILAEGDFDHDGINDLLISSSNSMRGGSYHAAHLYIVSRLEAGGPLVLRRK